VKIRKCRRVACERRLERWSDEAPRVLVLAVGALASWSASALAAGLTNEESLPAAARATVLLRRRRGR